MPSATYTRELNNPGRVPSLKVEVVADVCGLIYAQDPCGVDAGLGGTGDLGDDNRCYYTYPTCQARATFIQEAALTIDETFSFLSDAQSLVDQGDDASMTFAYEGSDGNPAGSVKFTTTVHISTDRQERGRRNTLFHTWESLFGLEPGSTVTAVELVDYERKVQTWASQPLIGSYIAFRLVQGDNSSVTADDNADLLSDSLSAADVSWTTVTGPGTRDVDSEAQDSSTVIGLEIECFISANAAAEGESIDVRADEIRLRAHYTTPGTKTYVFVTGPDAPRAVKQAHAIPGAMPCVAQVNPLSQEIKTKEGFVRTDKMKIGLQDVMSEPLRKPASDTTDASLPVLTPQNPGFFHNKSVRNTSRRGSFFRRFLKIHSNLKGRPLRVYEGFICDDWQDSDYELAWEGTVEDMEYGGTDMLTVHGVDALRVLEKEFPQPIATSNTAKGITHASEWITPSDTIIEMVDASVLDNPDDLSNGDVVIRLEGARGELMVVTNRNTSTNRLTVTRGAFGSTPWTYPPGTQVEEVYHAGDSTAAGMGKHPLDIAQDLMERAGVDMTKIDSTRWAKEKGLIGPVMLSHTVDEPKPFREILFDVLEVVGAHVFVEGDQIKVDVNAPPRTTDALTQVVDHQIIADSNAFRWNDPGRLTHAIVQFDKSGDNWTKVLAGINAETSLALWYGKRGFQTRKLQSEWIRDQDWGTAQIFAIHELNRRELPPVRLQFHGDIRDRGISLADLVDVVSSDIQDSNGDPLTVTMRIVKRTTEWLRGRVRFVAELWSADEEQTSRRYGYIGTNSLADYDSATSSEQDQYAWMADATPALGAADEDPYYTI